MLNSERVNDAADSVLTVLAYMVALVIVLPMIMLGTAYIKLLIWFIIIGWNMGPSLDDTGGY